MKKIAIATLLAAGVVIGGVGAWKSMRRGGVSTPDHVMNRPQARIDVNSMEVVTLPRSEWRKLGQKDGRYRNPTTKEYTMVLVGRCASCGKEIPLPAGTPPREKQTYEWLKKAYEETMCPHCHEHALEPPPPAVIPQGPRPGADAQ